MITKSLLVIFFSVFCANANPVLRMQNLKNEKLNRIQILNSLQHLKLNDVLRPLQSSYLEPKKVHPEWGLNVVQLIKKHGYPVEKHTVTTSDGYVLSLQRIPYGKNNQEIIKRPAVLVMPGILCSSADWVVSGPEKAIAYLLAEAGYDVWLGNNRGTTLSRKHISLDPDEDKEFWNFSYHEMGLYDLPAIIDYILEKTQQSDLHYVAHSQGTTSFFVMASELPEYNKKIRLMSALAPVTYSSNIKNPILRLLLPQFDDIMEILEKLGINEILVHSRLITLLGQALCNDDASTQNLCSLILFLATGFDGPQLNKTMLPVIYTNFPAGASVKQFLHFAQGMQSDEKFQQFDYGSETNLIVYGQETPPEYDLSKVTVPVAAYYSRNDWISSDVDVRHLISDLPNVVRDQLVEYPKFNHLDYMWAIDAKKFVYDYVIQDMNNFSHNKKEKCLKQ